MISMTDDSERRRQRYASDDPERRRRRYADDPEYRKHRLAQNRAWAKRNRKKLNAKARSRWATDVDFRNRVLAKHHLRWATDPDYRKRSKEQSRASKLKCAYGMTIEEYNALFAKQKGRCLICEKKSKRTLHVDHCHRRNVVRWLSCGKCNRGLGFFDDDPRVLRRAAACLSAALKGKPLPRIKPARNKRR
jgi:Recombination endonuclease VII